MTSINYLNDEILSKYSNQFGFVINNKSVYVSKIENIVSEKIQRNPMYIQDLQFYAENLPFNITNTGEEFNGYNLFNIQITNRSNFDDKNAKFVITDMNGYIISSINSDANRWGLAGFINSTTVLLTPMNQTIIFWNFYTNKTVIYPMILHHDIAYNPNSDSFITLETKGVTIGDLTYHYDIIVEKDRNSNVLWSIDTSTFIPHTYWNGLEFMNARADITHANSVFWDFEEDYLYVNMRNINTFYKINHSSGKIIWGIGEYGNFSMFNKMGEPIENLFYHAHAVEQIDENTFIIFDNDYYNLTQTDMNSEKKSRIIEIKINETTMTANESWVWNPSQDYYSEMWGDADRLPNGNRLGTFGTTSHPNTNISARLVEVNNAGNIVWEMNFPKDEFSYGIYRAERFRFSPIIEEISNIIATKNDNINVTWKTWYNFRTHENIIGSYQIYLDDVLIDSNLYIFQKFWQATNLSINLGTLSNGYHNLTLAVADEAGHVSVDYVNVTITDFYIERNGLEAIELGQDNSILFWDGVTVTSLEYNITVNSTLEQEDIWSGGRIEIDLNTLTPGPHSIELMMFNNSLPFYSENFDVIIYPLASPLIISSPPDQTVFWNQTRTLSWELFDHTPSYYEIYVNNSLYYANSWIDQNYVLLWDFPMLDEAIYNLTLVAYDQIGPRSSAYSWITVIPPSPPIITSWPTNTQLLWNESVTLQWEVLGGNIWTIWKNGSVYETGTKDSKYIELTIDNWQTQEWLPRTYNLTLHVSDIYNNETSLSLLFDVIFFSSDPYVDSFIASQSIYYWNGDNIVGAPDGNFSSITYDYSNGHITADMGYNEEILNDVGNDFQVYAQGGEYSVWLSNDLSIPFTYMTYASGNQSFDLASIGFDEAKYVRIEYRSGANVEVDAIEAIYYNEIPVDTDFPVIYGPDDFWVWDNESIITFSWNTTEITPWNYSIEINSVMYEYGSWNGSDIIFRYNITSAGTLLVNLTVWDLFGNSAHDGIRIDILASHTPGPGLGLILGITLPLVGGTTVGVIFLIRYFRKKPT